MTETSFTEQVLQLVSKGMSHSDIAYKFGVSEETVGLSIAGALSAIRSSSRLQSIIPHKLPNPLDPRETEVARLLVQGKSNREISNELFIAINTVKNHTSKIFKRLGVESRCAAAVKLQLIDLEGE